MLLRVLAKGNKIWDPCNINNKLGLEIKFSWQNKILWMMANLSIIKNHWQKMFYAVK